MKNLTNEQLLAIYQDMQNQPKDDESNNHPFWNMVTEAQRMPTHVAFAVLEEIGERWASEQTYLASESACPAVKKGDTLWFVDGRTGIQPCIVKSATRNGYATEFRVAFPRWYDLRNWDVYHDSNLGIDFFTSISAALDAMQRTTGRE